jgi:excisionase family DNA binding protein
MMNHLLTVREVAERLAIREGTVRLWLAQGRLPTVKCGRATRIPADSVEEFVRQNTVPARGSR